ncbi:MAG: radical SAM protein, partial [Clostridia bacterium]|nr:radical SAM protein [Clostridia bacterium]
CQNHDISRGEAGQKVTPSRMAEIFRELEDKGAHNINLVTGTHFIPAIIAAMRIYRPRVPVVWNTSGYETLAAIDAMAPYVDIWLPDYKYALPEAAEKYSDAPDYPDIAMAAIERMRHHAPRDTFDDDGMMTSGVIVRHLVLPANTRNSVAALRRLHDRLPDTLISLMSQYTPVCGMERYPELSRRITAREYDKVCGVLYELSADGFMQELSSSSSAYIPDWDMN